MGWAWWEEAVPDAKEVLLAASKESYLGLGTQVTVGHNFGSGKSSPVPQVLGVKS